MNWIVNLWNNSNNSNNIPKEEEQKIISHKNNMIVTNINYKYENFINISFYNEVGNYYIYKDCDFHNKIRTRELNIELGSIISFDCIDYSIEKLEIVQGHIDEVNGGTERKIKLSKPIDCDTIKRLFQLKEEIRQCEIKIKNMEPMNIEFFTCEDQIANLFIEKLDNAYIRRLNTYKDLQSNLTALREDFELIINKINNKYPMIIND